LPAVLNPQRGSPGHKSQIPIQRSYSADPVRALLRELPRCSTLTTFRSHDHTENCTFPFFPNTFTRWAVLFITYKRITILDRSEKMSLVLHTAGDDFTP